MYTGVGCCSVSNGLGRGWVSPYATRAWSEGDWTGRRRHMYSYGQAPTPNGVQLPTWLTDLFAGQQPPPPPPPPPNGQQPPPPNGAPPNGAPGALAKVKAAVWTDRSSVEKGAIVLGGAALLGLIVYGIAKPRQRYRPNLSKTERKRVKQAKPGSTVKVGSKRYKVGKIRTVKGGRSFGHKIPPKRYRNKGARRPEDYAWPEGYKYPLVFRTKSGKIKPQLTRKHIRAAARYYGKNRHLYPPPVRRKIARNINKAKKRFGIGGSAARP